MMVGGLLVLCVWCVGVDWLLWVFCLVSVGMGVVCWFGVGLWLFVCWLWGSGWISGLRVVADWMQVGFRLV